ncbi:MAG: ABC transporter permease [Candidatus Solibacter usitatus]|nr:ABC transporter permease [Candidatus Solibacter usitatus]
MRDILYAVRMLARSKGFTAAAVLCLALGIGATSAIFSIVNAVVLRPLPYLEPNRLVRLYTEFPLFPGGGLRKFWTSPPEFLTLRRDLKSWQSLEAFNTGGANVGGGHEPVRLTVGFVTGGLLEMLGVHPIKGRLLTPKDDEPGAPTTAVLSYGAWQRIFGGDENILARDVKMNGRTISIVGVMPKGFQFPPGEVDPAELWSPQQINPASPGSAGSHFLYLVGRLKPGVSLELARQEMAQLVNAQGEKAGPNTHLFHPQRHSLVSFPLHEEVVGGVRRVMLTMMAAVVFVLLIACGNVANLLLARAEARQREICIRTALGAGWKALLRQFLVEGIVLSLMGAVLGLFLAFGILRLIVASNAGSIPRASEVGIDWMVVNRLPGVQAATVLGGMPPVRPLNANDTQIEGFVPREGGPIQNVDYYQSSGDRTLEATGVRLIEGRLFDERDGAEANPVVVVNQTMARTFWPGQSPIGRRVRPSFRDPWRTVIGVVGDVKNAGVDKPAGNELFLPFRQLTNFGIPSAWLVVKTQGDPMSMVRAIRGEINAIDATLPIAQVRTLEDVVSAATARPRFLSVLLAMFSATALLLAALGIYGVMSYLVTQRTGEFGIRMSIGAQRSDVLLLVLRQGMTLAVAGIVTGVACAAFLTRLLKDFLFGVNAFDPPTFTAMVITLAAAAFLACFLPARRATKVDPIQALRYE